MIIRNNVYTILIVFLFLIQLITSGCSTAVTKSLHTDDLHKPKVDLVSQKLFQEKCSLCHELPEIDEYSSEEWTDIIDYTHDTKATRKFITLEESESIKGYLESTTQA
ncbi:MAG: hypothetical protein EX341_08380 [Candidatus Scalindua sp. SCAELEC01]|nr:hypothetical protein [Planctomycetota bacterium]RZV85006.1 MAG: hypothetical protein EX341_08380 [Candidatus Scalindua sp. SCAELEC01]